MNKFRKINLQLFSEEANPEGEQNIDNGPVEEGFSVRAAFGLAPKVEGNEEPKIEPEDKPEPEVEPETANKEPETEKSEIEETKPEADYDEIVYNKEKVKIPVTERQTYLQKGYNYDKVKQAADSANTALQKAAQLEGFKSVDDYLAELEIRERVLLAEQIDEAAGDPDRINEIVENHPVVRQTKEEKRKLEYINAKAALSNDNFFKEIEPELDRLMEINPTASPDLVYKVLRSDYLTPERIEEILSKEKAAVEKKIIADVHDKERRTMPTGGDTNKGQEVVQPSEFASRLSGVFGVSASRVAQRSHEKFKKH